MKTFIYLIICIQVVFCTKDDPDIASTTVEFIARRGYPAETYTISTKDGYLLTLHRIPYTKLSKNGTIGQPIFLQHGLTGCSADWVLAGNNSLAFILSDLGYDVWLGNARGNMYSRAHIKYTTKDPRYWDFSWNEMGLFDLPAALNFVAKKTQRKGEIIYVGHSMGTTMFFIYSSIYKEASEIVQKMFALAPVAYMGHVVSPIKYLAPFANNIEWIAKELGLNEFLPSNKILKYLIDLGCDQNTREMHLCEDFIFLFTGFDKDEVNFDLLPLVLSHSPAGTSTKSVIHYAQEIGTDGNFRQFDYGEKENLKRYGTNIPPSYNVSKIEVPMFLISAYNDWLAAPQDVSRLLENLPKNKVESYIVPLKEFNHLDFLWARDAPKLVYKPILKHLMNTNN